MLAIALVSLVAVALQAGPPGGAERVDVDLAALEPGQVHARRVASGRPFSVILMNVAPGTRYRVTGPGGVLRLLEPFRADDAMRLWATAPACAEQIAAVKALLSTQDEADVVRSMPGTIDRLIAGRCPGSTNLVETAWTAVQARSGAEGVVLGKGEGLELLVERLGPSGDTPLGTWRLRFETAAETRWEHADEATWLVDEVARDIAEMLLFARGKGTVARDAPTLLARELPPGSRSFQVSVRWDPREAPLSYTLAVKDGVWTPAVYAGLAGALLKRFGLRPSARTPGDSSLLEALTDPQALVMERENRRLSDWLARDMLSSKAHDQAALLLAALGLREAAGSFSDVRPTLCRMTAHLALARALAAPSPEGILAHVALDTLAQRQREAQVALDRQANLVPAPRGTEAWARALRLRATADWRTLPKPVLATLLERIAYYRALETSLGGLHALAFVRSRNAEVIPDWGRLAFDSSFSVEEGNAYAPGALDLEIREATEVYRAHYDLELPLSGLADALNAPPARAIVREGGDRPRPWVIGWGAWARFYQRHALNAVVQGDLHYRRMLGRGEEADERWRAARPPLDKLDLFPLAGARLASRQERGGTAAACAAAAPFWERSPPLLTASHWRHLVEICANTPVAETLSNEGKWFAGWVPPGTAFDVANRLALVKDSDPALLEELRGIAPFDRVVARRVALRHARTPAEFDREYGPLLEYDLAAMKDRALLAALDVEEYRRLYAPICDIDADSCLNLGDYLAARNREDEAAVAYRRAVDEGLDRVSVSTRAEWLVGYYSKRGRNEEALGVARTVAETGSADGLATMARLQEELGHYEDAAHYYYERAERYGKQLDLDAFYERYARRMSDGRCQKGPQADLAQVFWRGLERVTLRDFDGPPSAGVKITGPLKQLEAIGFAPGDVIVALDGYRVRNPVQYQCIGEFRGSPQATAIAWHGGGYVEVSGPLRSLQAGLRLTPFGPR